MATPAGVTLDDLLGEVGVTHAQLDKPCSLENLREIALFLESWRELAPHLGLSSAQVEAIERDGHSEQERRLKILELWIAKFAFLAKYRVLVEVLLKIGRANIAEKICRLLVQQQSGNEIPAVTKQPVAPVNNEIVPFPRIDGGVGITVNSCQHSALTLLHEEIKDLEEKYGVLTDDVLSALKKQHVSLEKIKSYLRQLPVSLKQQCHKFLQSQGSRLINATNIDELFWILSDYWDFINPSLLVDLAHKFGDEQTKASVDMYMKKLKEFQMRTRLKDFINQWTGQPRPNFHEIVLEFKDDWSEYTLEQLEEFRNAFLCKQWLERYAMPFGGIKEACVAAVFSLPKAIDSQDLENLHDFFQEHQILKVFLNGICIVNIQYMDYEDEVRQSSNYSKHASQIMQVASLVCAKCLKDDPSRINLITHKCFQVSLHSNEPRVGVEWAASSKCLKQVRSDGSSTPKASIRPIPRAFFRGEFVLCDRGRRCKGERCTFPHSVEERDVWNAEKFGRPLETTPPAEFEGITGPEWPSPPPSQPVKKTSAGTPPSAWLQPIQAQWEQQQSSTAHQKSSAPPLACATSAGIPTAPGVPTYPPEQLRSHQSHQTHLPRERYSSDPSNSRPPPHESPVQPPPPPPPPLVSHKLAEHHPDLHPELPQVKPSSFVSQTHQMCKSVSHVSPVQPSKVEPKGSSYLSFSLAALLSEALSSTESKFDSYQAATSDDVLPEINNMEPLQQPEHPQPPQQTGSSPWPDPYELGAKLPVQSPLIALLGAQPGNILPPSQLPQLVSTSPHSKLPFQAPGLPQPVSTSPHSKPPFQAPGLPQPVSTSPHLKPPFQAPGLPQPVSTSPHSKLPLQVVELPHSSQQLPAVAPTPTFEDPETGPQHDYAAKATKFLARVQQVLRIKDIQVELTQSNYKEKMHKLLCWEEKAHIEILGEKCNGQYTLVLHQAGLKQPTWMSNEANRFHVRFGYLLGLYGDQIAYATQASEGAYIVHKGKQVKVHILMENFSHTDERMYIALDRRNLEKLEKLKTLSVSRGPYRSPVKVKVEFELKHSYFNNLHSAVEQLSPEVIARILPQAREFETNYHLQIPDLRQYKGCSNDQLNALQTIATCPSNGPPILIAGAFGTGKTHILAVTAHYLFKSSKGNHPARVLVCTQQRASADTFLECYLDLMKPQEEEIYLIRREGFKNPRLKRWYHTVAQFGSYIDRSSYRNRTNYLIIAPCLTALQLASIIPRGFFTHILLDEGAQTREPEAVAPLCMAGRNTKIVIAGDQNQVGPAMLVLGDEAQENGLAVSLLERLHTLYGKLGEVAGDHCATLVTNYRCHQGILKLAEKLFYDLELKCNVPSSAAHSAAPYPLLFYCSSIDDKVLSVDSSVNSQEAEVVLKLVAEFAKKWPKPSWGPVDLSQMCLMSPTRSQLTVANQLITQLKLYQLRRMRRLPTYDVQGREFRALFLSTSEPTDKDGATRNPTKSICDRYVFNTAITRAQSLVVAVGNPFMLLRTERHMVQKYGAKGKCWSNYFKLCFEHGTLFIHDSLQVTETEKSRCIQKLQKLVGEHLARSSSDIWRAEDAAETSPQQPPQQKKATAPPVLLPTSGASVRHPGDENLSLQSRPTAMASPYQSVPRRQPKHPPHHHPPPAYHPSPPPHHPPPPPHHPPPPPHHPPTPTHHPPLTHHPPPPTHHPPSPFPHSQPPAGSSSVKDAGRPQDISSKHKPSHVKEEVYSTDFHGSAPTSKLEKEYEVKKRLGKGGFGVVYHVRNKLDRQEYAVKIIKLPSKKSDQEKVMREAVSLARLDHPKIVRYYTSWIEKAPPGWSEKELWAALKSSESIPYADQSPYPTTTGDHDSSPPTTPSSASTPSSSTDKSVGNVAAESSTGTTDSVVEFEREDQHKFPSYKPPGESTRGAVAATVAPVTPLLLEPPTCLFIQTELCREHTLYHWLREHIRNRPRKTVLNYFDQMLKAVVYIHEKGLVHRDLKPSNIFFSREGEDNLKVGDFGLVTMAGTPSLKLLGAKPEGQSYSSVAGTHFYMSPEQKAGVRTPPDQTRKIDIFALGVIFFELCCPFSTEMERFKVLTNLRDQKTPQRFADNLPIEAELIRSLLVLEPSKRPTAEHVHNCDPMKRLRKKTKKSQACIPVL